MPPPLYKEHILIPWTSQKLRRALHHCWKDLKIRKLQKYRMAGGYRRVQFSWTFHGFSFAGHKIVSLCACINVSLIFTDSWLTPKIIKIGPIKNFPLYYVWSFTILNLILIWSQPTGCDQETWEDSKQIGRGEHSSWSHEWPTNCNLTFCWETMWARECNPHYQCVDIPITKKGRDIARGGGVGGGTWPPTIWLTDCWPENPRYSQSTDACRSDLTMSLYMKFHK